MARMVPWIAFGLRWAMDGRDLASPVTQPVAGNHLAHQAEPQCRLRPDPLLVAHEGPAQDIAQGRATVQHSHRLEAGNDPHVGVRVEEHRVVRADDDVGLVEEVLPPPAHSPWTAATTGFQTRWCVLGASVRPGSKLFHTLSFSNQWPCSLMSTPVQNARSPLAWSTTQ